MDERERERKRDFRGRAHVFWCCSFCHLKKKPVLALEIFDRARGATGFAKYEREREEKESDIAARGGSCSFFMWSLGKKSGTLAGPLTVLVAQKFSAQIWWNRSSLNSWSRFIVFAVTFYFSFGNKSPFN
jgi:hypothetical protein